MQAALLEIWGRTRKTIIFVTHSIEEAVFLADRVIVMMRDPERIKWIEEIHSVACDPNDITLMETRVRLFGLIGSELKESTE